MILQERISQAWDKAVRFLNGDFHMDQQKVPSWLLDRSVAKEAKTGSYLWEPPSIHYSPFIVSLVALIRFG